MGGREKVQIWLLVDFVTYLSETLSLCRDTRQLLQTQTLVLIVIRGHPMEKFF